MLTENDNITLRLNQVQMGLGGDNSWGAKPLPAYLNLANKEYEYSFILKPIATADINASMEESKVVLPECKNGVSSATLDRIISLVESLDASKYTAASWAEVEKTLAAAKAVRSDMNASQADVDAAQIALQAAYDKLELVQKPVEKPDTVPELTAPTALTATNTTRGITLEWKGVTGAAGYHVYRKSGKGFWEKVKETTSLSYTDKGANKNATAYEYQVCAYAKNGSTIYTGPKSKTVKMYRLSAPKKPSVKKTASGKVTVSWKKISKVSGYQIKYVLGNKVKTVTVKGAKASSKAIKNLKKGKTYKFYVRTYKTVSKKKYVSAWSSVRKFKVK